MRNRIELKNQRGQTMVEFAVVLPILVLLLFGVVQFGIAFNHYLALTDAVRAGARKAAVSREAMNPVATTVTAVKDAAGDLNTGDLTISVTSSWDPGESVSVTASYPYSIHLLGLYDWSGRLKTTTTERVE